MIILLHLSCVLRISREKRAGHGPLQRSPRRAINPRPQARIDVRRWWLLYIFPGGVVIAPVGARYLAHHASRWKGERADVSMHCGTVRWWKSGAGRNRKAEASKATGQPASRWPSRVVEAENRAVHETVISGGR